jgi:hypothetical protein
MNSSSQFVRYTMKDVDRENDENMWPDDIRIAVQEFPHQMPRMFGRACFKMNGEFLDTLLNAGWDIDRPASNQCYYSDSDYCTPLISACEMRDAQLVKLLLQRGANPNVVFGNFSPLSSVISGHSAGSKGSNTEIVEDIIHQLFKHGALPFVFNWNHDDNYKEGIQSDIDAYLQDRPALNDTLPTSPRLKNYLRRLKIIHLHMGKSSPLFNHMTCIFT